jgi:hypothetical protein
VAPYSHVPMAERMADYRVMAQENLRPLVKLIVILDLFGDGAAKEMSTDKLVKKLRSVEYYYYLLVAEELGFVDPVKRHRVKDKWEFARRLDDILKGRQPEYYYDRWSGWTSRFRLSESGKLVAKQARETSALLVTKTRRYRL